MLVYTPREQMKDTQEARLDQSVTYHIHVDMTLDGRDRAVFNLNPHPSSSNPYGVHPDR